MDHKEISDIICAAEIYIKNLQTLEENIKRAEKQINTSGNESLCNIDSIFTDLKKSITNILDARQEQLKTNIVKMQNEGIKPLRQCQEVVSEKINKTSNLIMQGNKILASSSQTVNQDFISQSTLLGNLPAVPSLTEVPFIHFTYLEDAQQDIIDLCNNFGSVFHHSPVQINSITQKPGAILVHWEENEANDDKLNNIQEFRLQFAFGDVEKKSHLQANFHDCYIGPNTEFLKKDLKLNQPYSFRVCCKMEGSREWSPWSLTQVAQTCTKPFCWDENQQNFSLNNDNKLATKTTQQSALLLSNGAQFQPNHSIEFTILEMDEFELSNLNGIGLCDESNIQLLNIDNFCDINTFVVTFSGILYVGGKEKSTKLPHLQKGSKVSFTCEEVNDKVRIYVESSDKNVTYDWKINNNNRMYFFVMSESQKIKLLVE